jgi:hypothetical protein
MLLRVRLGNRSLLHSFLIPEMTATWRVAGQAFRFFGHPGRGFRIQDHLFRYLGGVMPFEGLEWTKPIGEPGGA